jgi:hypothetical protein
MTFTPQITTEPFPPAVLLEPPLTVLKEPLAVLLSPPLTLALMPLAVLPTPPPIWRVKRRVLAEAGEVTGFKQ